jgi:hypothetical protein
MTFNDAEYTAIIEQIEELIERLASKLRQVRPMAQAFANRPEVPEFQALAALYLANKIVGHGTQVTLMARDALAEADAPRRLQDATREWLMIVRLATGVVGMITSNQSEVDDYWNGRAAKGYEDRRKEQAAAAARIGEIARAATFHLPFAASAAREYFMIILVALAAFLVAAVGAIAIMLTPAVLLGVAGILAAFMAYLAALYQAKTMYKSKLVERATALRIEANTQTGFQDGRWPRAVSDRWSDAMPKELDGDASDWKLETGD